MLLSRRDDNASPSESSYVFHETAFARLSHPFPESKTNIGACIKSIPKLSSLQSGRAPLSNLAAFGFEPTSWYRLSQYLKPTYLYVCNIRPSVASISSIRRLHRAWPLHCSPKPRKGLSRPIQCLRSTGLLVTSFVVSFISIQATILCSF